MAKQEGATGLRPVGRGLHVAKSGRLIVRLDASVAAGAYLLDESGRIVGRIVELIGPVASPYASLQPQTDRIRRYLGRSLYASGEAFHRQQR